MSDIKEDIEDTEQSQIYGETEEYSEQEESDELSDNVEIDDEDYNVDDSSDFEDFDFDNDIDDPTEETTDTRITKPYLFPFERVRLLSDRTAQLADGAQPKIKNIDNLSAEDIAELELKHRIMPLVIRRPLPNGKHETWKISELADMKY